MNSEERKEARYQRRKQKRLEKRRQDMEGLDDFDEVFSFKKLYDSFGHCRKGISWKASVQRYNINRLKNTCITYTALRDGTYKFRGFKEFTIFERGKKRDIKSVHITDRVVQKCLCDSLVPSMSRSFIYDNCASLKGKGTDMAQRRFNGMLHDHYRKYGCEGYALCIDASSYFENIRHGPIRKRIAELYTDRKIVGLSYMYLKCDYDGRKGLSLGCQPNQIYAVGYQNAIDHYATEVLGLKYIRYNDDAVMIHRSKEYLKECLAKLKELYAGLGIRLSEKKTQIVKLTKGVTFLKATHYLKPSGRVVRKMWKKSTVRMRRKLKAFAGFLQDGTMSSDDIRASYGSWRGHAKKFDTHWTVRGMDKLFDDLFIKEFAGGRVCTE